MIVSTSLAKVGHRQAPISKPVAQSATGFVRLQTPLSTNPLTPQQISQPRGSQQHRISRGGSPVPELCRGHSISSATFYRWRSKFGGMDASLMARLKELDNENRRLKKMYAEERLKAEIVRETLQKSGEAILPTRNGTTNHSARCQHPAVCLAFGISQTCYRYLAK